MIKILKLIFKQIFPSIDANISNKKLNQKINSNESQSEISHMDNIDTIPIDQFISAYNKTFDIKNRIEDKAKTNVIAITIAITLIMGVSGLNGLLIDKYNNIALNWIFFIILVAAIIYLIVSGIDAIKVLFDKNTMSMVPLSNLPLDSYKAKESYDDCTRRNINRNLVRNNIVYSSYLCIRNALICLLTLFILTSNPLYTQKDQEKNLFYSNGFSISYSSNITIPDSIDIAEINKNIIEDKESREPITDGTIYSFVNTHKKYYIQYKCLDSDIIVYNFSYFDNVTN